jgi:hypothetical protein
MSFTKTDEYVAKVKLQRTSSQGFVSNFLTIWKGCPLMAIFNNVESCIININCSQQLENEDIVFLECLMADYIIKQKEREEEWKRTQK